MKIELRGGNWAVLRDPEAVTNGERKPLMAAITGGMTGPNQKPEDVTVDPIAVGEIAAQLMVESWSFDLPLPKDDPTVLDQLFATDYDQIQFAVGELLPKLVGEQTPSSPPLSATD